MKKQFVLMSFLVLPLIMFSPNGVFANEGHDHNKVGASTGINQEGSKDAIQAIEVGNKICPVSGESVFEMGGPTKYEYNGKVYNLCCEGCVKDFMKDPEKYSKIADEAMNAADAAIEESPNNQ